MQAVVGGLDPTNVVFSMVIITGLLIVGQIFKALDGPGIAAAGVLGVIVGVLGHWSWLLVLLVFLGTSHIATRWGWEQKKELGMCESTDGQRGWVNVAANGMLPGIVALCAFILQDWTLFYWLFVAAVSVAAADTWASEFGCLDPRVKLINNGMIVPPGTNGGTSRLGQWAALAGSALISLVALVVGWIPATGDVKELGFFGAMAAGDWGNGMILALITTAIGWIGCQIDSILGAGFENRGLMSKGGVNAASIAMGVVLTALIILTFSLVSVT
ncbi:MAG: DUF92 domain-containing protein [Candidatus Poseidoniaceae archaeon]|jgi:uncharacterized protein (TIGR00297 family)|nr:DUF92 domain-containing protein [Candidatus Poseidoniaceae archaeon]|tara:strand:- start:479 stop:1297 length:819 start_codon:yes stop_codon:yes gene_type:complete